jgi:hypothetical protein
LLFVGFLAESNQGLVGVHNLSDRANARSLSADHRAQACKGTLLTGAGALNSVEISLQLGDLSFTFLSLFSIGIIGFWLRFMHNWNDGLNWLLIPWISVLPAAVIVRVLGRGKTNDCSDTECSFHLLLLFNSDKFYFFINFMSRLIRN